jgi:2-C-methyl-D-erythritol 2,4-cyclodiphosphate synthase
MRSGIGYDVHRFGDGRRLVLGGVEIAGETGLMGHSDADVVAHAVMDALLGAAGKGDIGDHFPDSDAAFRDADSIELLGQVAGELGWSVANVDVTVIAERPHLGPYKQRMAERLAAAMRVETTCVNVKATTNEGMGFVGRGEGIAALAVAQLVDIPGRAVSEAS